MIDVVESEGRSPCDDVVTSHRLADLAACQDSLPPDPEPSVFYKTKFQQRFTEKDDRYIKIMSTPLIPAPCVENWSTRQQRSVDHSRKDNCGRSGGYRHPRPQDGHNNRGRHWSQSRDHGSKRDHDGRRVYGNHGNGYRGNNDYEHSNYHGNRHGYGQAGYRGQSHHQRHRGEGQGRQDYNREGTPYSGNSRNYHDGRSSHGR